MDSPIKSGYDENEGGDQMRLRTYTYALLALGASTASEGRKLLGKMSANNKLYLMI